MKQIFLLKRSLTYSTPHFLKRALLAFPKEVPRIEEAYYPSSLLSANQDEAKHAHGVSKAMIKQIDAVRLCENLLRWLILCWCEGLSAIGHHKTLNRARVLKSLI